jgi:hypothetical protein
LACGGVAGVDSGALFEQAVSNAAVATRVSASACGAAAKGWDFMGSNEGRWNMEG